MALAARAIAQRSGSLVCGLRRTVTLQPLAIHLVSKAAIALSVVAGQAANLEGRTVRENDVRPDDEHPALTEGYIAVIASEQLRVDLIGADIPEVSPLYDEGGRTGRVAATLAFDLLCLLAKARKNRRS